MFNWLRNIFRVPACPGCGTPLVEWKDTYVNNGYIIERKWYGCPLYAVASFEEMRNHKANWSMGTKTPLYKESK